MTKESLLIFPCDFPIKVFGLASSQLKEETINLVKKELPDFDPATIQFRASQQGKYLSLNVVVHVESQAQLDRIYQALSASIHILMVL